MSKIWPSDYGCEKAAARIDESLRLLQTDYIDLMLLHQPYGDIYGAYCALEDAYKSGKVRAIGVSNFYADRFLDIASNVDIKPAVNQVEAHVFNQETEVRKVADEFGTMVMGWDPLAQGQLGIFSNPVLLSIGENHGKTISQVALRYLLQLGLVAIPKSSHIKRMEENLNVFNFELSTEEMQQIKFLDRDYRLNDHRNIDLIHWFMSTMK